MSKKKTIVEYRGIGEDAERMHRDHEVQMARGDCYSAAKYAVELHKMLEQVSEFEGLDGWVQEKLTLACDYLRTVHEYMEHNMNHAHEEPEHEIFELAEAEQRFNELIGKDDVTEGSRSKKIPASNKPVDPKDLYVSLDDVLPKKPRGYKQYDPRSDFPVDPFLKKSAFNRFVKDPKTSKKYKIADESVFNETMSGAIASSMGQMNRPKNKVGTLFGGSFGQNDNPFKDALGKKPKNKVIRRK